MATILFIDDEEMIRALGERILQRDSHHVLTAENGLEAVSIFKENSDSIDIIIVDMNLDDMNGFEILTEVRKLNSNIPGIISSGNSYDDNDVPKDINNNIYFLQKPYKAQELTDLVASIMTQA